jgi:general secretion pathway protein D
MKDMPLGLRVNAQHQAGAPAEPSWMPRLCLRVATLLVALTLSAGSAAQEPVTLNFSNTEIDAVVRAIAQFTGKVFIVDPRVKGTLTLTIEQPLSPDQALAALSAALRMQGVVLVESGGVVRVVPEADAKLQGGAVQSGPPVTRGDELVTQVFRLNYAAAASIVQVLRPLIAPNNTISAYPANNTIVVTDYAENIRRIARIIASVDTPAGSEIDIVQLKHAIASDLAVLLGKILDAAAQGADASQRVTVLAEPTSNSLLIRSASPARVNLVRALIAKLDQPAAVPGNIHVVYLKNAEATRLARTLLGSGGSDPAAGGLSQSTTPLAFQAAGRPPGSTQQTQTPGGAPTSQTATAAPVSGQVGGAQIQADPTTNTLIITAPDAVYRQLRVVIDQLDVRRAQVFIESLIVEVTGDQAAEFGIQWQTGLGNTTSGNDGGVIAGTNFGGTGTNILGVAQNPASVGTGLNIGIARGQITLPGVGTITNLQFLARALERTAKANILSTPNLMTLDNEEARIIVGQNVPFITGQFTTPSSATVNPFQTIERRDVGLTLRVRPQISEGGTIKLVIYQEVSRVADQTNPAGIITSMRAIETNVLVDDGSIVVLGGLVQDSVASAVEKVPLLGDIPLIGQLFRYETRRQEKTNLMVFLRPYVVRDESVGRSLVIDRYDQMRMLEESTKQSPHPMLPDMKPPVMPPFGPETKPAAKPDAAVSPSQVSPASPTQ